jgi:hypothetical protein
MTIDEFRDKVRVELDIFVSEYKQAANDYPSSYALEMENVESWLREFEQFHDGGHR